MGSKKDLSYSIIIPIFNEAQSITTLVTEIESIFSKLNYDFEVIFVNDGSTDDSQKVLVNLIKKSMLDLKIISFHQNQGKSVAYMSAFKQARGVYIVTLDGDLQDDPGEIPKLINEIENGYDLVVGVKQNRWKTEASKKVMSTLFNGLLKFLFGLNISDSNSGFRVMRAIVCDNLYLYGDRYRFIPQLAHLKGFRVSSCPVVHRKRRYGKSKYGITRFWTGAIDILAIRIVSSFEEKPLQFFSSLAVFPLLSGFALEVYVLVLKYYGDPFRNHLAALISGVFLLLVAVQILSLGILGEMFVNKSKKQNMKYFNFTLNSK